MTTVTAVYDLTDSWVFDYLSRHCSEACVKQFKEDRAFKNKTHYDDRNGLILEKMAFGDVEPSPAPLDVTFPRPRGRDPEPLPRLPLLVIQEILSYLPTDDLFSTRLLSRDWNSISSESLRRHYRVPIRLQSGDQICKLAKTFSRRPDSTWLNPFVVYHFFPEQSGILPLLKLIGRDVKIGIFEFTSKDPVTPNKVLNLLKRTPVIEELCFYGHCDMDHVKGPVFAHLRKLGLSRGPSPAKAKKRFESFMYSTNCDHHLNVSILENWRHLAPALQELRCNYKILASTQADFERFAQLCCALRLVAITSFASSGEIGVQAEAILPSTNLTLEIRRLRKAKETLDTSKLIGAVSGSLNRLTLALEGGNVKWGELPRLDSIKVSVGKYCFAQRCTAVSFERLRTVTLEFHVGREETHPFVGDIFPTVANLRVILHSDGRVPVNFGWRTAFPEVTSLGVVSACSSDAVDMAEMLDHVTHLHLCQTGTRRRDANWSLAQVIFRTHPSQEWSLSTFNHLEHLEFECSWDLRRLVLEVMSFSVGKKMQPLQNLTISHNCQNVEKELELFSSLCELNWHKNMKMIFRQKPSYKAW